MDVVILGKELPSRKKGRMERKDGKEGWKGRMERKDGKEGWKGRMERKDGKEGWKGREGIL